MSTSYEETAQEAILADVPGFIFYANGSIYTPRTQKLVRRKPDAVSYQVIRYYDQDGLVKYAHAHALIARAFLGERPAGCVVDHIDRNKRNNAVSNLRYVTFSENYHNSEVFDNKTSKYFGVTKDKKHWRAQISVNGQIEWLGNHPDEITAAKAFDNRALELGLNRNLNFS